LLYNKTKFIISFGGNKMNKHKFLFVSAVMFVCLSLSAAVLAGQIRPLWGPVLLKAIRQSKGIEDQPSYEERASKPQAVKVERPKAADINTIALPAEKTTIKPLQAQPTVKAEPAKKEEIKPQPQITAPPKLLTAPAGAGSGDKLLALIPSDSLGILRINNLDNTLNQLDQYLGGVSPVPMGLSMTVRMLLAQTFGSPDLQGIDTTGSFAGFVSTEQIQSAINAKDTNEPPFSILMPVKNYNQFASKNSNIGKPDAKGISAVSSGGKPVLLTKQLENFALLVLPNQLNSLTSTSTVQSIIPNLESDISKQSTTDSVWLYVDCQKFAKLASSLPMPPDSPFTFGPIQSGPVNTADFLKTLGNLKYISISLSPQANVLKISATVSAMPGSETAQLVKSDSPLIAELIKQVGAVKPSDAAAKLTEVSRYLPTAKNADLIGTINLLEAFEAMMAAAQPAGVKPEMKATSSLCYAIKFGDGKITLDVALPKEHLAEIVMPLMMSFSSQIPTPAGGATGNIDMNSLK